jgi:uncharacterized protein YqeY
MALKEQLMQDLKAAMKEKDVIRKNVVTMIRADILQKEKDNKIELDDEGIMEVISKQLKQRKDALEEFTKGKRDDLVAQTKSEIALLLSYQPKQLSSDELKEIVKKAMDKLNITQLNQIGKLMAEVMPQVKGKADGKAVNTIIKELLNK